MLKMYLLLFSFVFLSISENPAWPQANQHWRYWTMTEGLAESFYLQVTISPQGNVWITHGSVNEVSWFDGYQIHHIPRPGYGLPVIEDFSGKIWSVYWLNRTGRPLGGIQQYKPGERQWLRYKIDEIHSADIYSFRLLPVDQERIFLLKHDRFMVFNAVSRQITLIKEVGDTNLEQFQDMIRSNEGGMWITGKRGAVKIISENGTLLPPYFWSEYLFDETQKLQDLRFPFEDKKCNLCGTSTDSDDQKNVLVQYDGNSWKKLAGLDDGKAIGFFVPDNSYWALFGKKRKFYTQLSLLSSAGTNDKWKNVEANNIVLSGGISCTAFDYDNAVWVGGVGGMARYAPPTWIQPEEFCEIDRICHTIYEDNKRRIWFACEDTLVLFQNGQIKTYSLPGKLHELNTVSLCSLPDGRLVMKIWNDDDLLMFNPNKETFDSIKHSKDRQIRFMSPAKDRHLLLETVDKDNIPRIEEYDGKSFRTILRGNGITFVPYIRYLTQTEDTSLWMAAPYLYGLACYKNGEYRTYNSDNGYPKAGAMSILDMGEENIWLGGRDSIYEFDGQSFHLVRSGFDAVRSMIKSKDGSIWAASANGLHRYHNGSWVTNTAEEGLPDAAVYEVFEDSHGRIWAGTTQGISLYHPDADKDPPRAYMLKEKNVKRIAPDGEAQFVFTGMDKWKYTKVDRLLYSHRIDKRDWSSFNEDTVAKYPGLSAGPHVFQVRAMDRNWNISDPVSWEFEVLLPWYKEPGFLIIITISSILILLFIGIAVNRHFKLRLSYQTLKQTQNQLIQSEKMASLGQLVAGVAHEINNPVNFIRSNMQPLKEYLSSFKETVKFVAERKEKLPADMKSQFEELYHKNDMEFADEDTGKLIQSLDDGTNRIVEIVSGLRQYVRVDKGYRSPYDLHEAIDSSLTLLHNRLKHHVTVHKQYGNIPKIDCSPGQMNQVFMNLLSNAEEAIEAEGNIWITTKTEGDNIQVQIRDDGKGISSHQLTKVFDPFFTTKPVGKGTGLGLSISYGIIEQHSGTIEVESEEGKGTTFKLKLPVIKDDS